MLRSEREQHLFHLADLLSFAVTRDGDRFDLTRTIDVEQPVLERDLSLEEAEELLNTWKLRGLQGG